MVSETIFCSDDQLDPLQLYLLVQDRERGGFIRRHYKLIEQLTKLIEVGDLLSPLLYRLKYPREAQLNDPENIPAFPLQQTFLSPFLNASLPPILHDGIFFP